MNKLFTTPRIPELIISYPFGGMIGRPRWRKNNHEESGLRSPSGTVGPRGVAGGMARTTQTALSGESDW